MPRLQVLLRVIERGREECVIAFLVASFRLAGELTDIAREHHAAVQPTILHIVQEVAILTTELELVPSLGPRDAVGGEPGPILMHAGRIKRGANAGHGEEAVHPGSVAMAATGHAAVIPPADGAIRARDRAAVLRIDS